MVAEQGSEPATQAMIAQVRQELFATMTDNAATNNAQHNEMREEYTAVINQELKKLKDIMAQIAATTGSFSSEALHDLQWVEHGGRRWETGM